MSSTHYRWGYHILSHTRRHHPDPGRADSACQRYFSRCSRACFGDYCRARFLESSVTGACPNIHLRPPAYFRPGRADSACQRYFSTYSPACFGDYWHGSTGVNHHAHGDTAACRQRTIGAGPYIHTDAKTPSGPRPRRSGSSVVFLETFPRMFWQIPERVNGGKPPRPWEYCRMSPARGRRVSLCWSAASSSSCGWTDQADRRRGLRSRSSS